MNGITTTMQSVLSSVAYKCWSLRLRVDSRRNDAPYLQWAFVAADAKTGETTVQCGRKWYLSEHMTESELVLTAFHAARTAEEHECRENFKYLGHRVLNPHVSITALMSVCDIEDVRS